MSDNGSNGRASFAVYGLVSPGGEVTGDVDPALCGALDAHREQYGEDPAGVVVNSVLIGKAREALDRLGLSRLQVTASGGCLAWEVWLEISSDGHKSLAAQQERTAAREILAKVEQLAMFEEVTT
jgi:hypothetical protein